MTESSPLKPMNFSETNELDDSTTATTEDDEVVESLEPPQAQPHTIEKKPRFSFGNHPIWWAGGIATFALTILLFAYFKKQEVVTLVVQASPLPVASPAAVPSPTSQSPEPSDFPDIFPGASPSPLKVVSLNPGQITWLPAPQITTATIFNKTNTTDADAFKSAQQTKFHVVATFADGSKLINAFIPQSDAYGAPGAILRFIQTPDGKHAFLRSASSEYVDPYEFLFNSSVVETKYSITELGTPQSITLPGMTLKKSYLMAEKTFSQLKSPQLIANDQNLPLYSAFSKDGNNLEQSFTLEYDPTYGDIQTRTMYLKLKDDTMALYQANFPFMTDDRVPQVTWTDGQKNTEVFSPEVTAGKCGSLAANIIRDGSDLLKDKTKVGSVSGNGITHSDIYQVTDQSNLIVKKLYDFYVIDKENDPKKLSLQDFAAKRNHFLWQDNTGDWVPFSNETYRPAVECGKPVIYLYPTHEQLTKVKVGADVTVSEPTYPKNGWTALAQPTGQLTVDGQQYSSLFWEGTGSGIYPSHDDMGAVVAQDKLLPTITTQLTQLGLNDTERTDFLEFWKDHLPTAPYVRLTWLDTADMNQLAPLQISPRPDTVRRVFLETEGMNLPRVLTPQKLTGFERKGFTVVEWGGLLVK